MWTVIYITQNEELVNRMISALRSESILARFRTSGSRDRCYEVMVPHTELESAQSLICDMI